jgi:acetyl esterase/lipase
MVAEPFVTSTGGSSGAPVGVGESPLGDGVLVGVGEVIEGDGPGSGPEFELQAAITRTAATASPVERIRVGACMVSPNLTDTAFDIVKGMSSSESKWRRRFRAVRISFPSWARERPDRLLYASNASGKWELYAWDRENDSHRQVTDRLEGTVRGTLDPSGEWIWWFDDEKGNELGRWMKEPFDGSGPPQPAAPGLRPAYGAGLALGTGAAVIGGSTDMGSTVHLLRDGSEPKLLYEHREEASVAGLSRDGELLALSHSEHGDSRNPALRVVDLAGSTVAVLWDGPGRGVHAAGWSRVPGDRRLLVSHERADLERPLVWSPELDEVTELSIDLPGEVGASWYPEGDALLVWHDHRGRVELYRLQLDGGKLERIDAPAGSIEGAVVRPDGELWLSWSNAATPPEVRTAAGVLLRPPGEPSPGGVAYTDLEVDGVHVFLAQPPEPEPHPLIFHVHGGPSYHDRDVFSPRVQVWVDHGFAVALVNYRGSTGYGKAWRDALEGDPGFPEVADVVKVRDRLVADGVADPDRVVLFGGSWGGYITLLGLGREPEKWSLGIAAVPVADYVAAFEDEMEPLKAFDRALFGGSPEEVPDLYVERSPITYVERVKVPVMILAGENDPRCPIRQIDNYIARLDELGVPHDVYRYDAGHGSLVIDETIRQTEAMLSFSAKHLGTEPPL